MHKTDNYKKFVEGKSDEEILACGGGDANEDPYLRVAAQVRSSQTLVGELRQAAASSSKMSERVLLLTKVPPPRRCSKLLRRLGRLSPGG